MSHGQFTDFDDREAQTDRTVAPNELRSVLPAMTCVPFSAPLTAGTTITFEFDLITSIAVTLLLLIAGSWAADNLRIFSRFSIPGPVIGGFAFALLVLILRQTGVAEFKVDTSLQSLAMLAFFTTIGLGASLGLVKKGGKILIIYLVACWTVAIFQNLIGIGLAKLLGIAPMLGIMAGAVSLEGGHGAAAAFGATAAEMGYENASTVAIAAATFGLIAGSLTGGPLATWLINRNKLKIETKDIDLGSVDQKKHEELDAGEVIIAGGIIAVVVVAGVALGRMVCRCIRLFAARLRRSDAHCHHHPQYQ